MVLLDITHIFITFNDLYDLNSCFELEYTTLESISYHFTCLCLITM